jgi:hypothetical protein
MYSEIDETPGTGREARTFERIPVPAFSGFEVELGPLGQPPAHSVPMNISRSGLQTRTGVASFAGAEGTECLIRFVDPSGRLAPDRTLGRVRRVEESAGYFVVAVEFAHPLDRVAM